MNDQRRKILNKVVAALEEALQNVEEVAAEEQDYLDEMEDQENERGQKIQETIALLEEAVDNIALAKDDIESAAS
jgi:ABC-type transporter Mla subunit MlaD